MIQPRSYQLAAIGAFERGLADGITRQLIVLPTGTGKTLTALLLAKKLGAPVLWLAHRDELIQQPVAAAKTVWPEASNGIVKAGRDEWRRNIVFASIQTAFREKRLERLARRSWSLVVVDECHHVPSASWRKVVEGVGCLTGAPSPLLGLTATPERLDSARLDDVFQRVAYQYHLGQAIEDGFLAPPDIVFQPIKVDLGKVHSRGGDFNPAELDMALLEGGIVGSIVKAVKEHAQGRKTLIFTVSIKQAEMVAQALRDEGLAADHIDGGMSTQDRRKRLRGFAKGYIKILANCAILTEGFDEPTIECVIMARPTQSKSLFIQCVGRGLRIAPGKENCRIVDLVALSGRHSLVQAPVIFGAELDEEDREKQEQALFEVDPIEYWKQRLSAQVLGLKCISRSDFRWIRGENDSLLLNVGTFGTVRLKTAQNGYLCEVVNNRETGRQLEPLADGPIDLELAHGIGEDYVRRCKAVTLARGGRWRNQPATPAQLEALRRWRIDPPTGLSKGQASDMLTAAAAKSVEPATPKQIAYLTSMGVECHANMTKREAGRLIGQYRG